MTKIAYLQCPTGLSGDMCLGALIHVGVPTQYLIENLNRLGISHEFKLWAERVHRNGQAAMKAHVELQAPLPAGADPKDGDPFPTFAYDEVAAGSEDAVPLPMPAQHGGDAIAPYSHPHPHPHPPANHIHPRQSAHNASHSHRDHPHRGRHLPEIKALIQAAGLPTRVTDWSLAVFRKLAEAEGIVHGLPPEQVHFHEVGATDAIVDIVGTCLGLDWLGIEQLYCSPLPTGGGMVRAAHGLLPVPTPAVLKLWEMRQVPIYSNGLQRELVTPTGAALATTLATAFGPPPPMTLHKVGLGAGSRELQIPNILQLWLGEQTDEMRHSHQLQSLSTGSASSKDTSPLAAMLHNLKAAEAIVTETVETIAVLETQIDDANPQAIAFACERLFEAGAVDVFTQAIAMKKGRLGTLITAICPPEKVSACEAVLFRETTTLGIRQSLQQRAILQRGWVMVQTPYGSVRIKVAKGRKDNQVMNAQPEYEDCAQLARQQQVSWQEVQESARLAWHRLNSDR